MPRSLLLLILLAGCGDPLSNAWFDEDGLFVAALPQEADLRHEAPVAEGSEERDLGDPAFMPPVARDLATNINGSVLWLLSTLDELRSKPITTREADRRIWGPYPWQGGALLMTVERSADALFQYRVEVAEEPPEDEPTAWYTLAEGEFLRGSSLRDGDGTLEFDAELWAAMHGEVGGGRMIVTHARAGDDVTLRVHFASWDDGSGDRTEARYFFRRLPSGGGVFEYLTRANVVGEEDSFLELWTTRARWLPNGAGRADFRIGGGDLGTFEYDGTECWDHRLAVTFYDLDEDGIDAEGLEDDCRFTREEPREIDGG